MVEGLRGQVRLGEYLLNWARLEADYRSSD